MLYMVTFSINIPPMLAYIPAPWILWVLLPDYVHVNVRVRAVLAVGYHSIESWLVTEEFPYRMDDNPPG